MFLIMVTYWRWTITLFDKTLEFSFQELNKYLGLLIQYQLSLILKLNFLHLKLLTQSDSHVLWLSLHSQLFIKRIIPDFYPRNIIASNSLFGIGKPDNNLWTVVFVDVEMGGLGHRREGKLLLIGEEVFALL